MKTCDPEGNEEQKTKTSDLEQNDTRKTKRVIQKEIIQGRQK